MHAPRAVPLKRVTLTLARSKDFPEGSTKHGYEFIAPIDQNGHIDLATWKAARADCTVRRFDPGTGDEPGMLVHKAGGAEHGSRWIFDYDTAEQADDEAGFLFGSHAFKAGEYVSVKGADGKTHTYTIASVLPLAD